MRLLKRHTSLLGITLALIFVFGDVRFVQAQPRTTAPDNLLTSVFDSIWNALTDWFSISDDQTNAAARAATSDDRCPKWVCGGDRPPH